MKGYFSRIASQSGLRFSSQGAVGPRRASEPHARLAPEPLDREKTVIVPPPAESKSSAAGALTPSTPSHRPVPENIALQSDRKKTIARSEPEPALVPSVPETAVWPASQKTVVPESETESLPEKQASSSSQSPVTAEDGFAPADIEQPVMVEPAAQAKQSAQHAPVPSRADPSDPQTPGKQYFAKTAAIIAGRVEEPVEVQTILLREVQEWAAAGAAPQAAAGAASAAAEGTAVDKSVEFSSETVEKQEAGRKSEPEAGVVRIGGKPLTASVPPEAGRIEEHSFDLSIGTISVVIEGGERPPLPTPAPGPDNRRTGHDTRHRPSRLGRNYL